MIGRNIVGYGGASLSWPRISLRNPAREAASVLATETALPHSVAPRPAANGTDRELVGTLTALSGKSDLNRPEEIIMRKGLRPLVRSDSDAKAGTASFGGPCRAHHTISPE